MCYQVRSSTRALPYTWQWLAQVDWIPYDGPSNEQCEAAFQAGADKVNLSKGWFESKKGEYTVHFGRRQVAPTMGSSKATAAAPRGAGFGIAAAAPAAAAAAVSRDDDDSDDPCDEEEDCESVASAPAASAAVSSAAPATVAAYTQVNNHSRMVRKVRRVRSQQHTLSGARAQMRLLMVLLSRLSLCACSSPTMTWSQSQTAARGDFAMRRANFV